MSVDLAAVVRERATSTQQLRARPLSSAACKHVLLHISGGSGEPRPIRNVLLHISGGSGEPRPIRNIPSHSGPALEGHQVPARPSVAFASMRTQDLGRPVERPVREHALPA